ncbi:hypothetical protein [Candidatus Leptofilum sp.]|uniref:hypothetical protein n=1 Tax=Candidatus Leptofilum sp. TaxID=3241576 RepID=UPI003B5B5DF8
MQIRRLIFLLLALLIVLPLASCAAAPSEDVATQELLLETDFSEIGSWPEMLDVESGTAVQLTNDGYELSSNSAAYVWGFGQEKYEDVVLETAVRQLSSEQNNAYGLVCRASDADSRNGYYFLISGDGLVSIRRVERNLSSPIVDWTPHSAVRQGARTNSLRAICAGDYLALYVNNQLVAEGEDGRFSSGHLGFAASGSEDGSVQVAFNTLSVRAAEISQ